MKFRSTRKIVDVFNCETGEDVNANEFFKRPIDEVIVYRSKLREVIQGIRAPLFKCYYCKQIIRIRGGKESHNNRKSQIFHFAHLKDTDECPYKTNYHLNKEEVDRIKYNGQLESILHQTLKTRIAECLARNKETKSEISSFEIEKRIVGADSKEWKQPDINAYFNNKRIAFELQLSTTWLDVITKRQHFYREQGIFIIWVFHTFNFNDYSRKLTFNDVIFTNNQNAYIFDHEAYELSKIENDLVLKCFYKVYSRNELELIGNWVHAFIKLCDLTFDEKAIRVFYYDSENQKKIVKKEIADQIIIINQLKESEILKNNERIRKRKELNDEIKKLTFKIDEIKKRQKGIDKENRQTKVKIEEKNELIKDVKAHVENAIKYFSGGSNFFSHNNSFYDLKEVLKQQFQEKVSTIAEIIRINRETCKSAQKSLEAIHNLQRKEIAGISYSCINNSDNWRFIKRNYSQIKTIHKNLVDDLFASDHLTAIKSDFELSHLQFSKDILFLMDFTVKIAEFQENQKTSQEILLEQTSQLGKISQEMQEVIEIRLKEEIEELQKEVKNHEHDENKLNIELSNVNDELLYFKQLITNEYS